MQYAYGERRALIAKWNEPPAISLQYTVQSPLLAGRSDQEWKVSIHNPTQTAIQLNSADITFNTGNDSTCIFTNPELNLVTTSPGAEGTVWVGETDLFIGTLRPTPSTETVTSWDISVTGVPMTKIRATNPDAQNVPLGKYENPTGLLYVPPNTIFPVAVFATTGPAQGPIAVTIVETLTNGDKARLVGSVNITAQS